MTLKPNQWTVSSFVSSQNGHRQQEATRVFHTALSIAAPMISASFGGLSRLYTDLLT